VQQIETLGERDRIFLLSLPCFWCQTFVTLGPKFVLIGSFQGENNTYLYEVETPTDNSFGVVAQFYRCKINMHGPGCYITM